MTTHPDMPGLTYQRDLGSGGFADVYLYHRQTPNRLVAIKVLRATNMNNQLVQQFTAEADTMAALTHPHIAQIYGAGITNDQHPYIEMAYYPNGSLQDQIRKQPLPVPDVLRIGVQLCSAIQTAHNLNPPLLHRDIKPANVLIDEYNDPALTDFGIATRITDHDHDVSLSVYWAAPEVMFPATPIGIGTDIYSLGALLYHLLAGHPPFFKPGGDNHPAATMTRTREQHVPPIGLPDVPASLERLLTIAMSKNPRLRPPTAADLARALQSIEQQQYGFAQVTPFKIKPAPAIRSNAPIDQPRVTSQDNPPKAIAQGIRPEPVFQSQPTPHPAVEHPNAASARTVLKPTAAVGAQAQTGLVPHRDVVLVHLHSLRFLELSRQWLRDSIEDLDAKVASYGIPQRFSRPQEPTGITRLTVSIIVTLAIVGLILIGLVFLYRWAQNTVGIWIGLWCWTSNGIWGSACLGAAAAVVIGGVVNIRMMVSWTRAQAFYRLCSDALNSAVAADQARVQAELAEKARLLSVRPHLVAEWQQADAMLQKSYSADIVPVPYRNIYAAYFLTDLMATSHEPFREALLHCDMDTIRPKLSVAIRQHTQAIVNQEIQIAQTDQLKQQGDEMIRHAIATERNTQLTAQYVKVAASNLEALAWASRAQFLSVNR